MSKLKNFFDATLVKRIASDVRRVHKTFDVTKFEKGVMTELEDFELKGRTNLIGKLSIGDQNPVGFIFR
jgi:hypothetical protein